jgi:hypothetical protein
MISYNIGKLNFRESILEVKKFLEDVAAAENISQKAVYLQHAKRSINNTLKKRKSLLLEEGYSNTDCLNLGMVQVNRTLQKGYVVVKINDIMAPIKISDGIEMHDDFDPFGYSINKHGSIQVIERASYTDTVLFKLIETYSNFKNFIAEQNAKKDKADHYKVGDRIHLKTIEGSYLILSIDSNYVTVSCNKWKSLGKPPRKFLVSDIKCHHNRKFSL